jgi:MFS family permease
LSNTTNAGPLLSRHALLSLYLPAAILALGQGIVLPAIPLYAKSFDVTFGVAAMVVVAPSLGSLVAGIPTGFLLDHVGRRKIILAAPILAALSSFLCVIAQSFPELLVYRFIGGIATQMWMLGRLAIITDTGGAGQRGRQITGMHATDSVGRISGPLVGGLIASAWDVRIPFIVHGLLCLVAVIPSFKLIQETAPTKAPETRAAAPRASIGRFALGWMLTVPILTFFVVQLFGSVTRGALNNGTLNVYAAYAYGADAATIGFLATAGTIIGIPIMIGAGTAMDRFGRKSTIIPGFTLLAAGLGYMALTAANDWSFAHYVAGFLLVEAANMITTGCMQTLGSDIAPAHQRGSFFGVSQTVVQVGGVLSPATFAILADNVNAPSAFLFLAVSSLSVSILVGTLIRDVGRAAPLPVHADSTSWQVRT